MWTGDLPLEQRLDSMGEWWLEIRSSGRLTASVPLFVGVESPQFAPLDTPGELVKGPGEAVELGLEVINEIRDQFELDALEFDRTLATLAKQPVVDLATGSWNGAEVQQALVDAGFVQGPVGSIACQAQTVVLCMDHLLRDPASRASWLTPSHGVVGGAAQVGSAGVHMVWNLASE
jgi:hypothetical protein